MREQKKEREAMLTCLKNKINHRRYERMIRCNLEFLAMLEEQQLRRRRVAGIFACTIKKGSPRVPEAVKNKAADTAERLEARGAEITE